jgi:16S rRNA (guanine966-N2)-methyltransferase
VTAVEKVSKHWKILQENFQSLEPTASGHSASAFAEAAADKSRRKSDASFQGSEKQEGAACLGSWQAIHADVYELLKRSAGPYDLIFADPPYEEADLDKLLGALRNMLAPDGILVFEMRSRGAYSLPADWNLIKEKKYGGTRMLFLEQTK